MMLYPWFVHIAGGPSAWGSEAYALVFIVPVSYLAAALVGYPTISYLKQKQLLHIKWLVLQAFATGALLCIVGLLLLFSAMDGHTAFGSIFSVQSMKMILASGVSAIFGVIVFDIISGTSRTIHPWSWLNTGLKPVVTLIRQSATALWDLIKK